MNGMWFDNVVRTAVVVFICLFPVHTCLYPPVNVHVCVIDLISSNVSAPQEVFCLGVCLCAH